jgi:hypothetical protein
LFWSSHCVSAPESSQNKIHMTWQSSELRFGTTCAGHGGSDGLHGYVQSLDHVVSDAVCQIQRVLFLDYVAFLRAI